jgi:hypothetical protein
MEIPVVMAVVLVNGGTHRPRNGSTRAEFHRGRSGDSKVPDDLTSGPNINGQAPAVIGG